MPIIEIHHLRKMKTEIQITHFLNQQTFKSETVWKFISSYCSNELKYNLSITPSYSDTGMTTDMFLDWFENGFASGDIAWLDGNLVILGACTLITAKIEGTLSGGEISTKRYQADVSSLKPASKDEKLLFIQELSIHNLQFGETNQLIIEKYVPKINERVVFHDNKIRGLGVVRDVVPEENRIEFYCYYIYDSRQIGYSMHEKDVCTLHEFYFEPMSISSLRRLNKELGKFGKVWNDRLHRIEPITTKSKKGEKYWYINDKMKIVQDVEKETPTSHFRYLAGNYFNDYDDCLNYAGILSEILRDRLARPEKPAEGI